MTVALEVIAACRVRAVGSAGRTYSRGCRPSVAVEDIAEVDLEVADVTPDVGGKVRRERARDLSRPLIVLDEGQRPAADQVVVEVGKDLGAVSSSGTITLAIFDHSLMKIVANAYRLKLGRRPGLNCSTENICIKTQHYKEG